MDFVLDLADFCEVPVKFRKDHKRLLKLEAAPHQNPCENPRRRKSDNRKIHATICESEKKSMRSRAMDCEVLSAMKSISILRRNQGEHMRPYVAG